ncbi:hypothetical protein JCM11641_007055 [Rhodosporidiobolus odoratus]
MAPSEQAPASYHSQTGSKAGQLERDDLVRLLDLLSLTSLCELHLVCPLPMQWPRAKWNLASVKQLVLDGPQYLNTPTLNGIAGLCDICPGILSLKLVSFAPSEDKDRADIANFDDHFTSDFVSFPLFPHLAALLYLLRRRSRVLEITWRYPYGHGPRFLRWTRSTTADDFKLEGWKSLRSKTWE